MVIIALVWTLEFDMERKSLRLHNLFVFFSIFSLASRIINTSSGTFANIYRYRESAAAEHGLDQRQSAVVKLSHSPGRMFANSGPTLWVACLRIVDPLSGSHVCE